MARLTRAIQKVFGISAAGNEIAQIGSLRAGAINYTTDPVVLQALAEYNGGLNSIVHLTKFIPALEDINAIYFLLTRQVAYGFQEGIAEYDATTEYHANSIVKDPGTVDLYYSLQNDNTGNALNLGAWWAKFSTTIDHDDLINVTANQHHAQAHTLASHTTKAHSELTGVTSDLHHPQAHTLASHSTKAHSELTGVGADDHHNESHTLASHSSKNHSELTNIGANDHHSSTSNGLNITPATIVTTGDATFGDATTDKTEINGYIQYDGASRVRAYLGGGAQTIQHNTWTKVEFDVETYDNLSEFDPTTNHRFTPTRGGYYLVIANVLYNTTVADKSYSIRIRKGVAGLVSTRVLPASTAAADGNDIAVSITDIVYLASPSDYIEIDTWHFSGVAKDIIQSPDFTWVSIHRIS